MPPIQGPGEIHAYSDPDGAEIYIDGNPVRFPNGEIAKTPIIVTNIIEGAHIVTFKMSGMMDENKTVDISASAWSDVHATMRPLTPIYKYASLDMNNDLSAGFYIS